MDINKIQQLAKELTDEEIALLVQLKGKQQLDENIDTDTRKKRIVLETRNHMDSVEDLITAINPKLKRSIDASKNEIRNNR